MSLKVRCRSRGCQIGPSVKTKPVPRRSNDILSPTAARKRSSLISTVISYGSPVCLADRAGGGQHNPISKGLQLAAPVRGPDLVEHLPAQGMLRRQTGMVELANPRHAESLHQSPGRAVRGHGEAHDAIELEGR